MRVAYSWWPQESEDFFSQQNQSALHPWSSRNLYQHKICIPHQLSFFCHWNVLLSLVKIYSICSGQDLVDFIAVFFYSHKIPPDSERCLSASWLNINSDWKGGKFWQMAKPLGLAYVKIHPSAAQYFAKVHSKGGQLTADINWHLDSFGTQEINNIWQAWGGLKHETYRKRSLYSASPCNLSSTTSNHLLFIRIQISKLKISSVI